MAIDVRHYADPDHDDYLLLWQYRQSTRFLALVTAFLEIVQAELVDPWDDFEAELSVSSSVTHWQDLMGARLGLIRPYGERHGSVLTWAASSGASTNAASDRATHPNSNRRFQWSGSESETIPERAAQFTGPTGAVGNILPIDDTQFREFLLAQVWRNRGGRSVTDIERMAGFIFGDDNVWVEELVGGGGIKLHIIAGTDTFFSVLNNNAFLPRPAGISLETERHDIFGVWGIQLAATSLLYKINLGDLDDRTGYSAGRALPTTLGTPIGSAGFQGNFYVVDRATSTGQTDDLWLIDPIEPASEVLPYGRLGQIAISGMGRTGLDYPSGMTQLGSDFYLLDGSRGPNFIYRFTSLERGAVAAVAIGRYPNLFNSVTKFARSIAGLGGDLYIGYQDGLMCKVDPNALMRTDDGYGTLSVTAAGSVGGILGMCAEPGRDDALLISIRSTTQALWRINPNNFADTSGDYGLVSTWAAAGIGTPIRSLATILEV